MSDQPAQNTDTVETQEATQQPAGSTSPGSSTATQPTKSHSPPRSGRGRHGGSARGGRSRSMSAGRTGRSRSTGRTRRNFGSEEEDLQAEIERYQRSPGPVYETGSIKDKMVFRHSYAANFGTEPRDKHATLPSLTPGPTYLPNTDYTSSFTKSPRATIGRAPRSMSVGRTAAAPDANIVLPPLETISRHSFHASFGTAKRTSNKKDSLPGPGAYAPPATNSKPTSTKGTFSQSKRGSGAWIFA